MAGPNDKRRMLDDEMSRFEAEISGPTSGDSLAPVSSQSDLEFRPIIGSNTFAQVKRQLKQAAGDDMPMHPHSIASSFSGPQGPPGLPGQMMNSFALQNQSECQGPMGPPGPGPRSFGPLPPQGFGQGPFRPGPPGPGQGMFGPNIGPRAGPGSNNFMPPGFMGPPHGRGGGGSNFPPGGMAPPPPPGFIPPQVNRAAGNNIGPGMNCNTNMGISAGRRSPPAFLRPPPPPPGLMGPRMPQNLGSTKSSSSIISKGPAIISSAPKLYSASKVEETAEKALVSGHDPKKSNSESKRKKQKIESKNSDLHKKEASHAFEMAEKVRQSVTTTRHPAQNFHPPPHNNHSLSHNNHSLSHNNHPTPGHEEKKKKSKKNLRYAGGQVWEDHCLAEWDNDDFRLFAGDLGNDVTDELLHRYFCHYGSFIRAKVVRDKRTNKSKGYGFISFKDSQDYIRAMKEMNGKYLGSRPIKLRKSTWKDRNFDVVQKKQKEKQQLGLK